MQKVFIGEVYDKQINANEPLIFGEYENCTFKNCDFSNADLSEFIFTDCTFIACNLSLVVLNQTALRNTQFVDSKLLGVHFDDCNTFGLSFRFDNCQLTHSSFYKRKIRQTQFKDSVLHEVDFTASDLSSSIFDNCDLAGAMFDGTILERCDFTRSYNYDIDAELNRIKKAKFSIPGVLGLLSKYDIVIE